MAPPNDLLANAEVVSRGYQTVTGTTVGAGWADEGAAGYDQPSVWYRLDTTILQYDCPLWVKVTPETGYEIWGEVYSVDDLTPDPEDLLTGAVGDYMGGFGDGTDGVDTQLINTNPGDVGAGMYYFVYVGNYNFDGSTGAFTIEFGVPWSVSAIDDPNNGSSTVTVLADAVRDEQYNIDNWPEYENHLPLDGTDSFYARPIPVGGKYFVGFRARGGGSTPNVDGVGLAVVRNGHCFPIARWEDGLASSPTVTRFRPMEIAGSYFGLTMRVMWPLWVAAGDEVAFRIFTDAYDVPSTAMTEYMEVLDVTFYPAWATWSGATLVTDYLTSPPATPSGWLLPQLDLGATTEIYSITVEDFGANTTDVYDIPGRDFVVLSDGTIYAAWCEEVISTGFRESLVLKKWDGAAWSTVTGDLWGRGTLITTYESACVSMDVNATETYAYIAWHERDVSADESYWRCKRIDLSDDTLTELGPSTGTSHYANSTRNRFAASFTQQLRLRVSPAGVPWVGWVEVPTADIDPPNGPNVDSSLPFLYYWDGAAWQDSEIPEPPTMTSDWWDTNIVQEPISHLEFTFCHADGPSEYPSAVYNVQWDVGVVTDGREFVYWEYDGATWSNSIQKRASLIWTGLNYNTNYGHWHQGMSLVNDGSKPHLVAALGAGTVSFDYLSVCTVESDASDFLALDTPFADANMAFYSGFGGWSVSTGEATVSPGGVIYIGNSTELGYPVVLGQQEAGDGTGWRVISRPNGFQWEWDYAALSQDRIRFANGKIYSLWFTKDAVLGVWVLTPVVVIPMNWRSSVRDGSNRRVLAGSA